MNVSRIFIALLLTATVAARLPAQAAAQGRGGPPPVVSEKATPEIMNEDPQTEQRSQDRVGFPGHKIIGNLYYIGTVTLSSFLITTPQGNIVINSDYEETLPLMKSSIESLGFKMEDTKILLASHAHPDHQTADAMFVQEALFSEVDEAEHTRKAEGCVGKDAERNVKGENDAGCWRGGKTVGRRKLREEEKCQNKWKHERTDRPLAVKKFQAEVSEREKPSEKRH